MFFTTLIDFVLGHLFQMIIPNHMKRITINKIYIQNHMVMSEDIHLKFKCITLRRAIIIFQTLHQNHFIVSKVVHLPDSRLKDFGLEG